MKYRIVKQEDLKISSPGVVSILSKLRAELFKMTAKDSIVIETDTPEMQKLIHRRMRTNIQHWKTRNGLKHVSVHLTTDGNVALSYEPNKNKRGAARVQVQNRKT